MQVIRIIAALLAFATASVLASPIPADSLSKKDLAAADSIILAREPEAEHSDLEILPREPSPICSPRMCP